MRTCSTCELEKPLEMFHRSSKVKLDGRKSVCKPCVKIWSREHPSARGERYKNYQAKYMKEYRVLNKEKLKEYAKAYELSDEQKAVKRLHNSRFKKQNRGAVREQTARRRASKRHATPVWVNREQLRKVYEECPKGFHVDHVIPLQSDQVCGLHVPWNLQHLSGAENDSKGSSFDGTYENEGWRKNRGLI